MRTDPRDSRFRGTRERYAYRGYLLTRTEDGRIAVEGGQDLIGDYPTIRAASRAIDYREDS